MPTGVMSLIQEKETSRMHIHRKAMQGHGKKAAGHNSQGERPQRKQIG